ncbi:glutamate receptor ionotropic, delta-1-like [Littorina saxatilis]|uniref:glutamate receptor ionotropic, delta-1-like n=1 Tax=Littorina saxatilis TaxID=31220 RepID=UPI0038B46E37
MSLCTRYDLLEPEDGVWGTGTAMNPDVGLYGQVINKKVDIGLGATSVIYRRSLLMDFSFPVVLTPIVMVYKKPPDVGWWVLFNPLSTHLMAAVGVSLVVVTCFICILEMTGAKLVPGTKSMLDSPGSLKRAVKMCGTVFQVTGGAALLKPTEVLFQSRPARILLLTWWMLTLVVAAAYSGTLTAFLSVAKQQKVFSGPRDLVSEPHDYKWGTVGSSGLAVLFENTNDTTLRQVWEGIQRFSVTDPDVISSDVSVLTAKVKKGNFVLFQSERFAIENFGEDCEVVTVDANIKIGMTAIVFPKGSALTKPVSNIILRLESSGLLSQWTDRWFPQARCPVAPLGPTVISVQHVLGLSLLLPLGVGLALLVLIVEKLYEKYNARTAGTVVALR